MANIHGVSVIDKWEDVTIAQFFLLDEINKDERLSTTEKSIKILAILSGVNESEFLKYSIDEISSFIEKDLAFLKTEVKGDLQDYYIIAGKRYKLVRKIDELTAGMFIDLMTYTKEPDLILDNLHLILTVFLLPMVDLSPKQIIFNSIYKRITRFNIGRKIAQKLGLKEIVGTPESYLKTPASATSEILYNSMKITDALSISVFFWVLEKVFAETTRNYLEQEMEKQLNSVSKTLENQPQTPETKNLLKKIASFQDGHGS